MEIDFTMKIIITIAVIAILLIIINMVGYSLIATGTDVLGGDVYKEFQFESDVSKSSSTLDFFNIRAYYDKGPATVYPVLFAFVKSEDPLRDVEYLGFPPNNPIDIFPSDRPPEPNSFSFSVRSLKFGMGRVMSSINTFTLYFFDYGCSDIITNIKVDGITFNDLMKKCARNFVSTVFISDGEDEKMINKCSAEIKSDLLDDDEMDKFEMKCCVKKLANDGKLIITGSSETPEKTLSVMISRIFRRLGSTEQKIEVNNFMTKNEPGKEQGSCSNDYIEYSTHVLLDEVGCHTLIIEVKYTDSENNVKTQEISFSSEKICS